MQETNELQPTVHIVYQKKKKKKKNLQKEQNTKTTLIRKQINFNNYASLSKKKKKKKKKACKMDHRPIGTTQGYKTSRRKHRKKSNFWLDRNFLDTVSITFPVKESNDKH